MLADIAGREHLNVKHEINRKLPNCEQKLEALGQQGKQTINNDRVRGILLRNLKG